LQFDDEHVVNRQADPREFYEVFARVIPRSRFTVDATESSTSMRGSQVTKPCRPEPPETDGSDDGS
jgi:hypothetical protein